MTTNEMPAKNTDRELWRESDDRSQTTPSIHVTLDGGIGINVGGTVIVMPLREWHKLANHPRVPFIAPNGMTSPVAAEVAAIARGNPIIAKPEQPPFAPKQFVRIKSSGTIFNVARCEKRVVHGALRWVVDDLNGMRAFASDCELVKNMELVNAETGEAVIHLPPVVRYACTKEAKVGDRVRRIDSNNLLRKVTAVNADGSICVETLEGIRVGNRPALQYEFVPEVTPVASPDFDFDEAANKAAAVIRDIAMEYGAFESEDWIRALSDKISAQIRPGVQSLIAERNRLGSLVSEASCELSREVVPDSLPQMAHQAATDRAYLLKENKRLNHLLTTHAPDGRNVTNREFVELRTRHASLQEHCRQLVNVLMWLNEKGGLGLDVHERITAVLTREHTVPTEPEPASDTDREQLAVAKMLLGQCDNRMFLVGKLELRRKQSGWSVFDPVANMFDDVRFADPIAAYQWAKTLLEAFGKEAGAT